MRRLSALPLLPLSFAFALLSCSDGGDKPKPVFDDEGGELIEYSESSEPVNASWREIGSPIDSAHPTTNNFARSWTVAGSAGAEQLKIVFERFELEDGYDFLTIADAAGAQRTRHTGLKTGQSVVLRGNKAVLRLTTDGSVNNWGFRVRAYEATPCICPAIAQPTCGADGTTYSNPCAAACAGARVLYDGQCLPTWFPSSGQATDSPHPYRDNFDQTYTITEGGSKAIRVHFSNIDVERGYDFVRVLDGQGRLLAEYTGKSTDVTSPPASGDTIRVQLKTDGSITGFGFTIDKFEVQGGCMSDADCGRGMMCQQIVCIRAPCFNQCVPANDVVVPATIAELTANPDAYHGKQVAVLGSPAAARPVCTRIACSEANPCCNRCSSHFTLGDEQSPIYLENTAGEPYGCSGNECNVASSCQPFPSSTNNGDYDFIGEFQYEASSMFKRIVVRSFRAASCQKTGCSGNMCANTSMFSTCEYRPEYACYQSATCEAGDSGLCAFRETPELTACLANAGGARFEARDTPIAIPDNNPAGIASRITVPDRGAVRSVRVALAIRHPYKGDLVVALVAPDGTRVVLHDRAGGSADDIRTEIAPVGFDGRGTAGDWTLKIQDLGAADLGTLESWSLTFE